MEIYGQEAKDFLELLFRVDKRGVSEEEKKQISEITVLSLSRVNLPTLPKSIENLSNLKWLYLSGNSLTILPESIGNLRNLQDLYLRNNHLTMLPESIGNLRNLKHLDLSGNNLTTLPKEMGNLKNLIELHFSENYLSELPDWIGNLNNLEGLYFRKNNLTVLPDWIENLSNLKELYLGGNFLRVIPKSVGKLSGLKGLYLNDNNLISLPEEIRNLKNLQYLYLNGNNFEILPKWIGDLSELKHLSLSVLFLHSIPRDILNLGLKFSLGVVRHSDDFIHLYNTKLATQPIQLFAQPRELIEEYYNAPKVEIKDAKVIFLGNGGAGKTHTIERILNKGEQLGRDTATTDGIDIHSHDVDDHMTVKFWDFGGQEIMHSMHRCFLTGRSLYVIVVANRNDSDSLTSQAEYWLKNIESFAPGCPVLIAINKIDGNNNTGINTTLLKQRYPNLVGQPIEYNAKGNTQNNAGEEDEFAYLTKRIFEEAHKLDSVGMEFPEKWEAIRQGLLDKQKQGLYYIDKGDYHTLCTGQEDNPDIQKWLLEWFNDMGVCFSYHQENGEELEKYQILKPEWLTNAIYIIINKGKSQADNGKTTKDMIYYWLNDKRIGGEERAIKEDKVSYSEDEVEYVLQIMRKFRLSYQIDREKGTEFIPEICSADTPKNFHETPYQRHYSYQLEYEYLPDSVIHRLMIACYNCLNFDKLYRKGFRIEQPYAQSTAVVDMGTSIERMTIDIYTDREGSPYEFYQWLRGLIEEVNQSLGISVKEEFVIGEIDGKKTKPVDIKFLLDCSLDGETTISWPSEDGFRLKCKVDDLLGSAFSKELIQKAEQRLSEKVLPGGLDRIEALMREVVVLVRERNEKEEWLLELLDRIRTENNAQLQRIADELEKTDKKSRRDKLSAILSDGNNARELMPVLKKTPKTIAWIKENIPVEWIKEHIFNTDMLSLLGLG